jgi:hypothetical protein
VRDRETGDVIQAGLVRHSKYLTNWCTPPSCTLLVAFDFTFWCRFIQSAEQFRLVPLSQAGAVGEEAQ